MRSQHGGRQIPPIPGHPESASVYFAAFCADLAEVLDRGRSVTWPAAGGRRLAIAFMRFRCVRCEADYQRSAQLSNIWRARWAGSSGGSWRARSWATTAPRGRSAAGPGSVSSRRASPTDGEQ